MLNFFIITDTSLWLKPKNDKQLIHFEELARFLSIMLGAYVLPAVNYSLHHFLFMISVYLSTSMENRLCGYIVAQIQKLGYKPSKPIQLTISPSPLLT